MNDRRAQLEDALRSIPDGVCSIQILETGLPPIRSVTVRTEGKGRMTAATIFPGIELSYWQILAPTVSFRHEALHDAIEVTFCRSGRAGWNLTKGFVSYVGAGATAAHMMDCCADSAMSLPLGYFEGAGLAVDFRALNGTPADIIASAGTTAEKLIEKYGAAPVVFPPNQELERIFSSLYDTPEPFRPAACKIAALELLLYLVRADIGAPAAQQSCDAQLASVVQDIHAVMTANLDKRYTIDELAKTYFINTSSLKTAFKAVYGQPIAAYMRSYRIRRAMELLQQTDDSIAAIAAAVGYETQGKFTKAFKEATQLLPRDYRKTYRKAPR